MAENLNETNVNKWDYANSATPRLLSAADYGAIDGARSAPAFYGDIFGDWREEVVYSNADATQLLVFTTPIASSTRIYTLPHNPEYRNCMTMKGYMQQHNLDYFLGNGMSTPPTPNIKYVNGVCTPTAVSSSIKVNANAWQDNVPAVTVNAGDVIILGPHPITGGSWSWTGLGTSGTAREQTITATVSGIATATYTNDCGAKSTLNVTITVNGTTATTTYQAENYTSMSGIAVATAQAGYTGTGYADYGATGTWLEWNNVASAKAGTATLVFTYANGASDGVARTCNITVNGTVVGSVAFATTGSWTTWKTVSIPVNLNAGNNAVRVTATASVGGPNLDKMDATTLKSASFENDKVEVTSLDVKVSPNPVQENEAEVIVNLAKKSEVNLTIINVAGKVVYHKNLGIQEIGRITKVIDISSLAKGTYIVQIQTSEGSKTLKMIRL